MYFWTKFCLLHVTVKQNSGHGYQTLDVQMYWQVQGQVVGMGILSLCIDDVDVNFLLEKQLNQLGSLVKLFPHSLLMLSHLLPTQ